MHVEIGPKSINQEPIYLIEGKKNTRENMKIVQNTHVEICDCEHENSIIQLMRRIN